MANWTDLPPDLLARISDFCPLDYIRMQSVCKSWRSIFKKRPELPWLMMLPNSVEEGKDPDARIIYSLSKRKIHTIPLPEIRGKRCCGSFQNGWLMIVGEKLDIFLFHPWTQKKIPLPHLYNFVRQNFNVGTHPLQEICDNRISKVALSDDAKVAMFVYSLGGLAFCIIGVDDVYTDVKALSYNYCLGRLAFCRIGDDDDLYTDFKALRYVGAERCPEHLSLSLVDATTVDVIYHKGHFYTLNHAGAVFRIRFQNDEDEVLHALFERLTPNMDHFSYGYLVPDMLMADRLLVISRDLEFSHGGQDDYPYPPYQTRHFDVFGVEVSLEQVQGLEAHDSRTSSLKELTKVESLGDQVIFLGYNSPIVVMANQFPGLKGNCIYFTESNMGVYNSRPQGCHDLGIFSLENGTVEKLFADRFHPNMSPPIWIATPPYSV